MIDKNYEYFSKNMPELYKKFGTFLIQECFKDKKEGIHCFQGNVILILQASKSMSNSYKSAAFTSRYDKLSNALFSELKMKSALQPNKEIKILALCDTGATSSVIHSEIAKELGLHVVSECCDSTPSDVFTTNRYYVSIMWCLIN